MSSTGISQLVGALAEFEGDLSPEEQQNLQASGKPTTADVLKFTTILSDAKNEKVAKFSKRVLPFLTAVQNFSHIVDTFIQSNPTISALLWGAIKFAVQAAFNFVSYVEKLSTMFLELGNLCPIYENFQSLYPRSMQLQDAIAIFYGIVVQFCKSVVTFCKKSATKKFVKSLWKDLKNDFQDFEDKLSKQQDLISLQIQYAEGVVNTDRWQEYALFRDEQRRHMNFQVQHMQKGQNWMLENSKKEKEKRWNALLESVSKFDYAMILKDLLERKEDNTGKWLLVSEEFKKWNAQGECGRLWCHGIPGSGKSMLMAGLLDHLWQNRNRQMRMIYFFCSSQDAESLVPETVISSLIKQIMTVLGREFSDIETRAETIFGPSSDKIVKPDLKSRARFLKYLISICPETLYVVLDGVDEMVPNHRRLLLTQLEDTFCGSGSCILKTIFSSRDEVDIRKSLKGYCPFRITAELNEADIMVRIEAELLRHEHLCDLDATSLEFISSGVLKRANGMFLLAHFLLEEIVQENDLHSIKEVLTSLPEGINAVFQRIISRLAKHYKLSIAKNIFAWIICSRRILSLDELGEAVSIQPGSASWAERHEQLEKQRMLQNCGPLVVYNLKSNTVQLAHCIVQEFLTSLAPPELQINTTESDADIGRICLTYIAFSEFKTSLIQLPANPHEPPAPRVLGIAEIPSHVAKSALISAPGFGRISETLTSRLRPSAGKAAAKPEPRLIAVTPPQSDPAEAAKLAQIAQTRSQFQLLGYVLENWLSHCKDLLVNDQGYWSLFRSLVRRAPDVTALTISLPWDDQPPAIFQIKDSPFPSDRTGMDPLSSVFQNDHRALFKPLSWAFQNDHLALFKLCIGITETTENLYKFDPINVFEVCSRVYTVSEDSLTGSTETRTLSVSVLAYFYGSSSIIQFLRDRGAIFELAGRQELEQGSDFTLLEAACLGGNFSLVQSLLSRFPDLYVSRATIINSLPASEKNGFTALQAAALTGNTEIVSYLLSNGADSAVKSSLRGYTAIEAAARSDNLQVLGILLNFVVLGKLSFLDPVGELKGAAAVAAEKGLTKAVDIIMTRAEKDLNTSVEEFLHSTTFFPNERRPLTVFQMAAASGDVGTLEAMLQKGARFERDFAYSTGGRTALQAACEKGHMNIVEYIKVYINNHLQRDLASNEASRRVSDYINRQAAGSDGLTALCAAITSRNNRLVELLLDLGAKQDLGYLDNMEGKYYYPLVLAIKINELSILKLLIRKGAKPLSVRHPKLNWAPAAATSVAFELDVAIQFQNEGAIDILLSSYSLKDLVAGYGKTNDERLKGVLIGALKLERPDMCKYLRDRPEWRNFDKYIEKLGWRFGGDDDDVILYQHLSRFPRR